MHKTGSDYDFWNKGILSHISTNLKSPRSPQIPMCTLCTFGAYIPWIDNGGVSPGHV